MVKINVNRNDLRDKPVYTDPTEVLLECTKVLNDAGLIITGLPDTSGKIQRVSTVDDKGRERSGWYVAFDGEVFGGAYGNFKTGKTGKWSSVDRTSMTAAQIAEHQRQMQVAKAEREKAQNELYAEAAKKAEGIMSDVTEGEHDYAKSKNITGMFPIRNNLLLVPAYDQNSKLSTIQFISPDGTKRFLTGGRKKGCYHIIAGDSKTVYVCEGWATGKTINEATGKTVAVAFDSGNLMSVTENVRAKFPNSSLVVAGDDDHENKKVNVGRQKAKACADALGLVAVFPPVEAGETDFNDVGVERTKAAIEYTPKIYKHDQSYDDLPDHLLNPPGILKDMATYYNATARSDQPGFAVQTALAIGSIVCGRRFITTKRNLSSLYFLNVADSGTGKEHIQTLIQEVLKAANKENLLLGSGYTSAGGVFSALLTKPRHISVIDEFGRYLEATRNKGNSNLQEANTKLMEAIGRLSGILKPPSYSTMTLAKDLADAIRDRWINFPAITLATMTTPSTLIKNISSENVSDGFLGRFILHISHKEPQKPVHKDWIDVPKSITEWIEKIDRLSLQNDEIATEEPSLIELSFDKKSLYLIDEFEDYKLSLRKTLKPSGMDALPGRCVEFAMRLSIIVALAKNPETTIIDHESTAWSIKYIKFAFQQLIDLVNKHVSDSPYERNKKSTLEVIKSAGEIGIKQGELFKRPPLKALERDKRDKILSHLVSDGLIIQGDKKPGPGGGRPTIIWYAIEQDV